MHRPFGQQVSRSNSRYSFVILELFVVFLAFGCTGNQQVGQGSKPYTINCEQGVTIDVDSNLTLDHDKVLCAGYPIKWLNSGPASDVFKVDFTPDDSPFPYKTYSSTDGKLITTDNACEPKAPPIASYKYTLYLGTQKIDPHVIILGSGKSKNSSCGS